jgi:diacylglycerol kinase
MPDGWEKSKTLAEASGHAWDGVLGAIKSERNVRIQIIIYIVAFLLGWLLGLPAASLALILLVGSFIVCLELINTALETLANVINPNYHEALRNVKDMAAGAVLIASLAAIAIGLLLFIPAIV